MNEFLSRRVVKGDFTIANAAATNNTGIFIPAGAIIQGISFESTGAVTKTAASGTVVARVGSANICATVNLSTLPAQTVIASTAVALNRIATAGELQIVEGVTGTSTAAGTYYVYVDYIYVA